MAAGDISQYLHEFAIVPLGATEHSLGTTALPYDSGDLAILDKLQRIKLSLINRTVREYILFSAFLSPFLRIMTRLLSELAQSSAGV